MKRKLGTILMILGAVLICSALSLLGYNRWDSDRAGAASETVLESVSAAIEETVGEDGLSEALPLQIVEYREMTVVNIDGNDYIGYVSIPSIGLNLPVMSEWSYPGLKIAPGRFSGSTYSADLVICGHNYARHFSPIKWLDIGTEVDFTDMDGIVWRYTVSAIETLQPTQVEEMSTKQEGDDWDLTLFTCNTGGQTRCAVRCITMS